MRSGRRGSVYEGDCGAWDIGAWRWCSSGWAVGLWSCWRRDLKRSMVWGVNVMLMREGICCGWVWEVVGRGMSGGTLWVRGGGLEVWVGSSGGVVWSIGEDFRSGDGVGSGGFQAGSIGVDMCGVLGTCVLG